MKAKEENDMKLEYTQPEIEITLFATEAIMGESDPGETYEETAEVTDEVTVEATDEATDDATDEADSMIDEVNTPATFSFSHFLN